MKPIVVVMLVLVLGLVAAQVRTVGAVAADETGLGFNEVGQKIVNTGRNVWVPVAVVIGILAIATMILVGARVAGLTFRFALACALFAIAITGTGLVTLFPGLIVAVTLP